MIDRIFNQSQLITGALVHYTKTVGYCTCNLHRGFLSEELLIKHQCLEKECVFFRKHNEEYWKQRQAEETRQQRRRKLKDKIKTQRDRNKKNNELREMFIKQCKKSAEVFIAKQGYNIIITRVAPDNGNFRCDFIINYLSDRSFDDYMLYYPLVLELSKEYGKVFRLRRVRTPDGRLGKLNDVIYLKTEVQN